MNRFKAVVTGVFMVLGYFVATTVMAVVTGVVMFSLALWSIGMPNPGLVELIRVSAAVTFVAKFISRFFKEGE